MIKTARQLKDLIRNLSKDKSADAQILMRNYMMERFLSAFLFRNIGTSSSSKVGCWWLQWSALTPAPRWTLTRP